MKGLIVALGISVISFAFVPYGAKAQKIIHMKSGKVPGSAARAVHSVRLRKFGRIVRPHRVIRRKLVKRRFKRLRFAAFALPDQRYYPPYYDSQRPWVQRPDLNSRIEGGKTVEGGSRYRSKIKGGKSVEGGSRYGSRIKGGKTVEGGSRWASRIKGGRSIEQGSRLRSRIPNWRFSGYAAPFRPKGIPYYSSSRRVRSPWASRL